MSIMMDSLQYRNPMDETSTAEDCMRGSIFADKKQMSYSRDPLCMCTTLHTMGEYKCPLLAKIVGSLRLRKLSESVIHRDFHAIVGAKTIGSSGNHSQLVVEAFDGAAEKSPRARIQFISRSS